ncbi:hypothetical protein Trydic_g15895 [Trypoxylus dichotomus]
MMKRSGMYQIACNDCGKVYIGQTKRSIETRFKERIRHYRFDKPELSSVAEHMVKSGHKIDLKNLTLLKNVNSYRELDAYETICMKKNGNLLNREPPPIAHSSLIDLLP